MSRRLKTILGLGILLIALACVYDAFKVQAPKNRPNLTAKALDGQEWSLAEYRGKQPVLVSFFSLT